MGTKLICSAQNCVHNADALCNANKIEVEGTRADTSRGTQCETFAQKGYSNAFTSMTNMNVTGEVKQFFNKNSIDMSPKIVCRAQNCNYNENQICTASNVQIHGPNASNSEGTECETFIQ